MYLIFYLDFSDNFCIFYAKLKENARYWSLIMLEEKITKEMTIEEAVRQYPETIPVFLTYGLHCIGCHVANWETIEQGAVTHGIADFESMMKDLNKVAVSTGR